MATLTARRLSGDASHGAQVQVTARVMGDIVEQNEYTISSKGTSRIQFEMPTITSSEAEGTLTCVVRDGGTMQSISKTIPVVAPARDLIIDEHERLLTLECAEQLCVGLIKELIWRVRVNLIKAHPLI